MSEGREYDALINALGDVNILSVEAVGTVIGRFTAKVFKGMVEAGLPELTARKIISDATRALFMLMMYPPPPVKEEDK